MIVFGVGLGLVKAKCEFSLVYGGTTDIDRMDSGYIPKDSTGEVVGIFKDNKAKSGVLILVKLEEVPTALYDSSKAEIVPICSSLLKKV